MEQILGILLEIFAAILPSSARGCFWTFMVFGMAVLIAWLIWG
jgi:hypothetical protein